MDNLNGVGRIVGALVVGAIGGAVLGVLFAPAKGSKTRSNIVDGAKDLAGDIKKSLTDQADALRKKADELESLAKEKMDEAFHSGKQKTESAEKK